VPAVRLNLKFDIIDELKEIEATSDCRYVTCDSLEKILIQKYGITLHRFIRFDQYSELLTGYFHYNFEIATNVHLKEINFVCKHYDPVGLIGFFASSCIRRHVWFRNMNDMIMFKLMLNLEG